MWFKKYLVIFFLFVLGIGAGVAAFTYMSNLLEPHHQQVENKEPLPEEETEPPKEENQYAGVWTQLPRERNLVVLIDNDVNARPQSGLGMADYIYEVPIEGGTTRFVAVFSRFAPDLIGPIRSARDYTIVLAKEHDPIFVHAGGSPQAYAMFDEIGNLNGLEGGVDRAFWRTTDREPPYNLYSDTKTLRRVAQQEGFRQEGELPDFRYLEVGEEFQGSPSEKIKIDYGHKDFGAEFLYDKLQGQYLRFTGGVKHWDWTGNHLAATNIIIQVVDTKVIDQEGRLALDLTGKGRAAFFSAGQVIQGYWEKEPDGLTKFYKGEGDEISLQEGPTWICIVPMDVKITY